MQRYFRARLSTPTFISALILFVILIHLASHPLRSTPYPNLFAHLQSKNSQSVVNVTEPEQQQPTSPPPPPPPQFDTELHTLHRMVSKTKGYYARDYSLWLGWNNMRYILESAILHGRILNRTTIIPTHVYARACEFDSSVCDAYAAKFDRGDQLVWKLPITLMLNLTHLRETHPVVTLSEYFRLHNISDNVELLNGTWHTDLYHTGANIFSESGAKPPSLFVIEKEWYDTDIIRVDQLPLEMRERGGWESEKNITDGQAGYWGIKDESNLSLALRAAMVPGTTEREALEWDTVLEVLKIDGKTTSDSDVAAILESHGWEVVYTYGGGCWFEAAKEVVVPIKQAVPRTSMRGLYDDFGLIEEDVLLLKGEIHSLRKSGFLRFTTIESREAHTETVLYGFRFTDSVLELADLLANRMIDINGGRMWMGAHMRRGDFAILGWTIEDSFEDHLDRIKVHLDEGRDVLHAVHYGPLLAYRVPFSQVDRTVLALDPPIADDKFYIATDERNPTNLAYLRDQGAILISDLLTMEDRRKFGWALMITDVLSLVEQAVLARSSFVYVHWHSSVAGGIMNLRAARGADPRASFLDM